MNSLNRISVSIFPRLSRPLPARNRSGQEGYTLLFAVFLCAVMLITLTTAVLKIETQGQREREEEMVWRGHQYERGIRRYVAKFGRYPTKIDDLVKATSGVRYMREAYKDPMNKDDGTWRFIYVTPAGALIGSVRYTSLIQMALMDKMAQFGGAGMPGMAGMPGSPVGSSPFGNSTAFGGSSAFGNQGSSAFGQQGGRQPGAAPGSSPQNPNQSGDQGTSDNNNSNGTTSNNNAPGNPPAGQNPPGGGNSSAFGVGGQPSQNDSAFGFSSGPGGSSPLGQMGVIGGSITGVGSKVEKPSLKVYKGAKKYKEWEFIYNPIEQQAQAAGGMGGGLVGGTPTGQQGTGSSFGNPGGGMGSSPFSPQPNPPGLPPNNPQPRNP
jgi:type II secretory pathway pseudopilin PulG